MKLFLGAGVFDAAKTQSRRAARDRSRDAGRILSSHVNARFERKLSPRLGVAQAVGNCGNLCVPSPSIGRLLCTRGLGETG